MENLEDKIKEFMNTGYGSGSGYGDGDGYGSGYSDGSGYGDGSGDGSGYGYGDGSGYGDGYGSLKKFNNSTVFSIDGIETVISHVKDNIVKCEIINKDFTASSCYIVKGNGYFAHGKTIKEAQNSLVEKYMQDMNEEDVIEKFMNTFEKNKKYKCSEFFKWHNYLTGSCKMGRESFMRNHEIKMADEFTVDEFIDLTINDYGSSVIEHLKIKWNEKG